MSKNLWPGLTLYGLVAVLGFLLIALASSPVVATETAANVSVYNAGENAPKDLVAVRSGIQNGSIAPAEEVYIDEYLLVVIESPRLADSMANGSGSPTDRFLSELAGPATFRLVQTNPTPMKNRKIARIGPKNTTVYRSGNSTFLLIDTGTLDFRYRTVNRSAEIFGSEEFAVEFGYDLPELPRGGTYDAASPVIDIDPYRGEFHTAGYWYEPLPPEWVEITVDVEIAPEHQLSVRIRTDGDRSRSVEVAVTGPPEIQSVWLDLREFEPGNDYVLELVHDGRVIDRFNGTVRTPQATISEASVVELANQTAVRMTATLSHGGKVQVLNESCEVLGTEWVEPGENQSVQVELWTRDGRPLRIENRSDAGLYIRSLRDLGASSAVYRVSSGTARIGFDGACDAPEPRATPTISQTPTAPSPASTDDPGAPISVSTDTGRENPSSPTQALSPETVTPGQPGFTFVIMLFAVLAIGLLARLIRDQE